MPERAPYGIDPGTTDCPLVASLTEDVGLRLAHHERRRSVITTLRIFRVVHAEATATGDTVLVHLPGAPTGADERLRDYLETWFALTGARGHTIRAAGR